MIKCAQKDIYKNTHRTLWKSQTTCLSVVCYYIHILLNYESVKITFYRKCSGKKISQNV